MLNIITLNAGDSIAVKTWVGWWTFLIMTENNPNQGLKVVCYVSTLWKPKRGDFWIWAQLRGQRSYLTLLKRKFLLVAFCVATHAMGTFYGQPRRIDTRYIRRSPKYLSRRYLLYQQLPLAKEAIQSVTSARSSPSLLGLLWSQQTPRCA